MLYDTEEDKASLIESMREERLKQITHQFDLGDWVRFKPSYSSDQSICLVIMVCKYDKYLLSGESLDVTWDGKHLELVAKNNKPEG